jgi:mono/diheme cytochrome c family protein
MYRSLLIVRTWLTAISLPVVALGTPAAEVPSNDLVARGAYLANAGDCIGCHTAKGGKPLAGGQYIQTPFGGVSTPNITPDKTTGIGNWTDEEFYRSMHEGLGKHGEPLYPVMPFPWYTTVTREDVMAIRAWLATRPSVNQPRLPNKLSFPYSVRDALYAWRAVFFKPTDFAPDAAQSAEVNRGAYLVNGLAHCGECHNARPVAGTSKWRQSLQGGSLGDWYAPNITSDVRDGIGAWSNTEIATYLKTGAAPGKGIALGPMSEAVHSLSRLNDADLLAIAAYLKTTPAKSDDDRKRSLYAGADARGAGTYLNYCASCHGIDGQGLRDVIPALNGNGSVTAKGPENVISVVLGGLPAQGKYAPMPAIGAGMSNEEVAEVANYVRQTWANAAPPTAMPGTVAKLRSSNDSWMTAASRGACPRVESPALVKAMANGGNNGLRQQIAGITNTNMPQRTERLVNAARAAAPGAKQDELINGLTAAYCTVVSNDKALNGNEKSLRLGQFSQLVYAVAAGHPVAR